MKKNEKLIQEYIEIRNYLESVIESMIKTYLTYSHFNPLTNHILIQETKKLITNELTAIYPSFPKKYLPNIKFKINHDIMEIESGIQVYFNSFDGLMFLGCCTIEKVDYDLYCRTSFDSSLDHMFYARNGHNEYDFIKGSKLAKAEYFMGLPTPLLIAYSFALEDGIVEIDYEE
jgi:hypothetical protein